MGEASRIICETTGSACNEPGFCMWLNLRSVELSVERLLEVGSFLQCFQFPDNRSMENNEKE
ncbi:hypothetical protein SCA6_002757 [Theobroma cacao]